MLRHLAMQRLILLATLFVLPSLMATQRPVNRAFATRSETIAPNAMACTSHPLATQAALEVLKSTRLRSSVSVYPASVSSMP